VGVQGPVEQLDPFADEEVRRVLGLGRGIEPGLSVSLVLQWCEGADRSGPGKRQLGGLGVGLGALWAAAPARAGRGSSDGADD
jgi:hypothetical protein